MKRRNSETNKGGKQQKKKDHTSEPVRQNKGTGISRRDLLKTQVADDLLPVFEDEGSVPVREGLGIVIVGASSGMGAEMARQYADHGAYVVLAARRTERLEQVAAEVEARGGFAHVIPTDVRNEPECIALVQGAINWLAGHGKVIDILALAPARAQGCAFGQEMSTEVWRNVIETSYFGPAYCLKHALSHLKANNSTLFFFNSISSSIAEPINFGYTSSKHAWRGILNIVRFENPEVTVVSMNFSAVDTEIWDKELTCFNNDKRYCPSVSRTLIPTEQMYPKSLAVEKAIRAIESQTPDAYLSLLSKAAYLIGFTRQEMGVFLRVLEVVMGHELVQQLEAEIRERFRRPDAAGYIARLLKKICDGPSNELTDAAGSLYSVDRGVSLYLLALDALLDDAVLVSTRQAVESYRQSVADGSMKQLLLALSSGTLSPPGIADDNDGLAPVINCPPPGLGSFAKRRSTRT